jgi:hypothetical protein
MALEHRAEKAFDGLDGKRGAQRWKDVVGMLGAGEFGVDDLGL